MYFEELTDIIDKYRSNTDIFHDLMPHKMREILLVSTLYDAFILEREGQLSEQIYGEYYQLNLQSAPRIISTYSVQGALKKLKQKRFDLVILMVGLDFDTPLLLSSKIKDIFPKLPVVMLFNNNSNLQLFNEKELLTTHIDRSFVWNGDSSVFLAMIKCVEDRKNSTKDTKLGQVRVILLVEDNIKYYSRYLPLLYSEILKLTQALIAEEELEEMNKMLRMRARPKVLLASNYEEAKKLYLKYEDYLLAVISDFSFPKKGVEDKNAGPKLVKYIRHRNKHIPIKLQSAESTNALVAEKMGISFLDKNSETLIAELRTFIRSDLGFGPFYFRCADNSIVDTADTLVALKQKLLDIPDEILERHAKKDDFSTWLMARGEIQFAKMLKKITFDHFSSTKKMRQFIIRVLNNAKQDRIIGRVVNFNEEMFNSDRYITRFSNGSLGGKGRGLSFINHLLERAKFTQHIRNIEILLPTTAIIGTNEFDSFIDRHNLSIFIQKERDLQTIKAHFLSLSLSEALLTKLKKFIGKAKKPIAVRSSGLFEDMLMQPFAGIYDTFLLPNNHPDADVRLKQLSDAIKLIYASIFSPKAHAYFHAVHYKIEEEKMAVILQEVVGVQNENLFYPHISGVAASRNHYPIENLKPEDGVAVVALGLGTYVVDGEKAFRFSPKYPKIDIVSPEQQIGASQNHFYALDLENSTPDLIAGEEVCYKKENLPTAEKAGMLLHLASVYDYQDQRMKTSLSYKGARILNFANILKYNQFPLAEALEFILDTGSRAMGSEVEIEFAVDMSQKRARLYLLQLKPLIHSEGNITIIPDEVEKDELLLCSKKSMGNGIRDHITDIIFINPNSFDKSKTAKMALEVGELNKSLVEEDKRYILIGPGRWGTRDPWLGIPVSFDQISHANIIVEAAIGDFKIDSSLGSHFFHNITSMNIGYMTVPGNSDASFVDWEWLSQQKVVKKLQYTTHIQLDKPVFAKLDGKNSIGYIKKSI
ncbi:pyruvate, phosphate dikinase [bacterium]|nr:pyruvate, phosphate dikinase [bacterium]